jgi:hypothetical protein
MAASTPQRVRKAEVERVVLNALANGKRLRRLIFAPSATIAAVVFGEADPPLMRRARDTPVATEVGAIDLNRRRAVRVNRPYLFLSAAI